MLAKQKQTYPIVEYTYVPVKSTKSVQSTKSIRTLLVYLNPK